MKNKIRARTVPLFGIIVLAVLLPCFLIINGCSGKKTAERNAHDDAIAELNAQIEELQATLQAAGGTEIGLRERGERRRSGQREGTGRERGERRRNAQPSWKIGDIGPNGGLVYYTEPDEYYEVFPPQSAIGVNDALPSGWLTPDMEDLMLIYEGLQHSNIADYGSYHYISVTKTGGKNQYLVIGTGDITMDAAQGRKIGVRAFDPSQPSAKTTLEMSAFASALQSDVSVTTAAEPSASGYKIGAAGPGGGIVFSAEDGKYKEITMPGKEDTVNAFYKRQADWSAAYEKKIDEIRAPFMEVYNKARAVYDQDKTPENLEKLQTTIDALNNTPVPEFKEMPNPFPGWRWATMPELITAYDALKRNGFVNFGNVLYVSSSMVDYANRGTKYTRNAISQIPSIDIEMGKKPFMFSDVNIILTGGGPSSNHVMDMGDGAIILVCVEDIMSLSESYGLNYKNFTLGNLHIPLVREF